MRVVFPFTAAHPLALEALGRLAPCAEWFQLDVYRRDPVTNQPCAYYDLLLALWQKSEDLLIIEQDVEIHADVLPQLEACLEPWCLFPYGGPGYGRGLDDGADHLLKGSLGCTRFRAELIADVPDLMTSLPVKGWQRLDCEILPRLRQRGYQPHLHYPVVDHHHVYDGHCACGRDHE